MLDGRRQTEWLANPSSRQEAAEAINCFAFAVPFFPCCSCQQQQAAPQSVQGGQIGKNVRERERELTLIDDSSSLFSFFLSFSFSFIIPFFFSFLFHSYFHPFLRFPSLFSQGGEKSLSKSPRRLLLLATSSCHAWRPMGERPFGHHRPPGAERWAG